MKNLKIYILIVFLSLIGNNLFGQSLEGVKIHINPGHGGYDSDDRGISTPLYPNVGPNVGFWESQSNLDKGLQLKEMLEALGAEVQMSREHNRETIYKKDENGVIIKDSAGNPIIEFTDDTPLSQIVRMANEFQADFMLSIHSNAGAGVANYVLMLYAGVDDGDTHIYPTPTPKSNESKTISTEIAKNLIKNQLTQWTNLNYSVRGDKTYGRVNMHPAWSDGYGVLRGLTVPGVISEGSMHDYYPETYRLMNMEYKWLEAWNFKKAFVSYFKDSQIQTGVIAGWVKDSRNLIMDGIYTRYGKDKLLPLDGAKLTILETNEVYTVDNNRNGVYVFKDLQPGTYTVKAEVDGYYSQEQKITVIKNEIAYFNFELNKIRNTPPEVVSYSPNVAINDSVETSTDIVLEFNWDMDEESVRNAFSITPAAEGEFIFEDSQYRMRFKPHFPLEKSTVYTIKLEKSAKHPDNMSMENDLVFQFTTKNRNRLELIGNYPNNGNKGVFTDKPLFQLIFDKELESSNLREKEYVYDSEGNVIKKAPRSVKINNIGVPYGSLSFELTQPLVVGKTYTLKLDGDIKDISNVMLVEPVEINFIASNVRVLDKTIVDDFEESGKYKYEEGQSQNVVTKSASISRSTTQKLFGAYGYNIKSKFNDQDAYAAFLIENPQISTMESKVFGLHIYGDMSGNELQLQFTSGSEIKYFKLCDIDFLGWQFTEILIEEAESYLLTGIRIVRKEGILSHSTDIYVDNLLQYDTLISGLSTSKASADIHVYPNPASDMINITKKMDQSIERIELYTLSGQLIRATQEDSMPVSDISSGTYIVKVKHNDGIVAKPVIIKK